MSFSVFGSGHDLLGTGEGKLLVRFLLKVPSLHSSVETEGNPRKAQ